METVSEFRKFDDLIGWLVFAEKSDSQFLNAYPSKKKFGAADTGSSGLLLHYTTDPAGRQRIIDRIRENGGDVQFEKLADAAAPIRCKLKHGRTEGWIDSVVSSTSREMALCMAIVAAAHRILANNGIRHVSLEWLLKLKVKPTAEV